LSGRQNPNRHNPKCALDGVGGCRGSFDSAVRAFDRLGSPDRPGASEQLSQGRPAAQLRAQSILMESMPGLSILFEHDLSRKPVSTPDRVRGRLFRDHALMMMMNEVALVAKLIEHEAEKRQADRPPSFLLRQFPALGLRDVNSV